MIIARPIRRRFEHEGCEPLFDCSPASSLACSEAYVDLGISTNAQGAVGGGNIFNAAPLFGSQSDYTGGSNSGSANASPTSTQAAMGSAGGAAGAQNAATPVGWNLAQYLPYLLAGLGILAVVYFFTRKGK